MSVGPDPARLLERALAYPGAAPAGSFALGPGGLVLLGAHQAQLLAAEPGRTALVAYGSNAAPDVLRSKLGPEAEVFALAAGLPDSDVVYSAHLAAYGAVPATLWSSPGSELQCHVLLLGGAELASLDATEPNYERQVLAGVAPRLGSVPPPTPVWAYRSRHGALRVAGSALAVAPIRATGRCLAATGQAGVLAHVRNRLDPGRSLFDFVARAVGDAELRATWTARLRADALWPPGPRA